MLRSGKEFNLLVRSVKWNLKTSDHHHTLSTIHPLTLGSSSLAILAKQNPTQTQRTVGFVVWARLMEITVAEDEPKISAISCYRKDHKPCLNPVKSSMICNPYTNAQLFTGAISASNSWIIIIINDVRWRCGNPTPCNNRATASSLQPPPSSSS